MNILFVTLLDFSTIEERGIYSDLMRAFVKQNHHVYIVSPLERRKRQSAQLIEGNNFKILKPVIGNMQKTGIVEKSISLLTVESKILRAIESGFADVKFDLMLYSTPPIMLHRVIKYIKNRDGAKTYLLLKDIFPQNAVDLGLMKTTGIMRIVYLYFRRKEKQLYKLSDYIGCMSQANVNYVLAHNKQISIDNVEVCPNSIEPLNNWKSDSLIADIRLKFGIPLDKTVFIYGGNLGRPQGIDFLIECLRAGASNPKVHFIIAGSGTAYGKVKAYFDQEQPHHAQLLGQLSTGEFDSLTSACDVGLIFLDNRFTIPNFPSRLLSYMQASIPVLAATDSNTDIGQVIVEGRFGYWCESNNVSKFLEKLNDLCDDELRRKMGEKSREYLDKHYTVQHSCEIIMNHFKP